LKNSYTLLQRILHKISLENGIFLEASYQLEKEIQKSNLKDAPNISKVFITGLARSGTTSILNHLVNQGSFFSLGYKNLPFIMMPNLSKKIYNPKINKTFKERAHGDSILVNEESPEAIDEVFWKMILENSYIGKNEMNFHKLNEKVIHEYLNFIFLHLQAAENNQTVYCTKNNNNILRLSSLENYFPNDTFIITFRDPVQHALSLRKQHLKFVEKQKKDPFILSYFNSLGHHEFGLGLKPFYLGDDLIFSRISNGDSQTMDYWLYAWLNYYKYFLNMQSGNEILISFENLCANPNNEMKKIFNKTKVKARSTFEPFEQTHYPLDEEVDAHLISECYQIYNQLLIQSEIENVE
jgi:hypothetical protein